VGNLASDNRPIEPKTEKALKRLKREVADDLGLDDDIRTRGWENMTTHEVGKIGGNMVRRLVKRAESELTRKNK
jgi:ribosomal protein S21